MAVVRFRNPEPPARDAWRGDSFPAEPHPIPEFSAPRDIAPMDFDPTGENIVQGGYSFGRGFLIGSLISALLWGGLIVSFAAIVRLG